MIKEKTEIPIRNSKITLYLNKEEEQLFLKRYLEAKVEYMLSLKSANMLFLQNHQLLEKYVERAFTERDFMRILIKLALMTSNGVRFKNPKELTNYVISMLKEK